jgi:hypothetical protein
MVGPVLDRLPYWVPLHREHHTKKRLRSFHGFARRRKGRVRFPLRGIESHILTTRQVGIATLIPEQIELQIVRRRPISILKP